MTCAGLEVQNRDPPFGLQKQRSKSSGHPSKPRNGKCFISNTTRNPRIVGSNLHKSTDTPKLCQLTYSSNKGRPPRTWPAVSPLNEERFFGEAQSRDHPILQRALKVGQLLDDLLLSGSTGLDGTRRVCFLFFPADNTPT